MEKSLKTITMTAKMQLYVTLLITHAFVNFVAVHDKVSEVQSSEI